MLRGSPDNEIATELPLSDGSSDSVNTNFPGLEQPYATGGRLPGILFYRTKESFWLPYHLLERMEYQAERIRLVFAMCDVVVEGRGLHRLYVELSRQVVWRVVEQGVRYAVLADTGTLIIRIERAAHTKNEQPQP